MNGTERLGKSERERDVIIACDFPTRAAALTFLGRFPDGEKPFLKVGMELFYGEGPDIVRAFKALGHAVFLDLKLHDIPNTVGKAAENLARLGVDMLNVHAGGGRAMMRAARDGLNAGGGASTKLIAVTQLTSTSEQVMRDELLIQASLEDTVLRYADNAKAAGLDGIVCSPLEVRAVKGALGASFLTVTPGIRPAAVDDDQRRVTTPADARALGSDYIVVGRPITGAQDPIAAYRQIRRDFLGEA